MSRLNQKFKTLPSAVLTSAYTRTLLYTAVTLKLQLTIGASLLTAAPETSTIAGDVSFHSAGSELNITQLSDKAIVNWADFSIRRGETFRFIQPHSNAAILNRVTGQNISDIQGSLLANGQVYLLNPNGIAVGKDGVINTAGFLGSTHHISNADFLNGGQLTLNPGKTANGASILNLGKISANGGDIFLIADHIENSGQLEAKNGTIGIAAAKGAQVLLADSGDQRLSIQPSLEGSSGKDGVINNGTINAVNAELKAAGGNIYALAINNDGAIRANSAVKKGGRILLTSKGGNIKLGSRSNIAASNKTQGGTINIGGSKQGKGPVDNAANIHIEEGSKISADATSGDGGSVIVFAENHAEIAGNLSAKGGRDATSGGFIETSGKGSITIADATRIDTSSAAGIAGNWLIDPTDITIANAGGDISAFTLVANLSNNDVTIQTAAGAGNGDITINDNLLWDTDHSLTFLAHRHINFNANVQNRHSTGGDLNIVAGWDGSTDFAPELFDTVNVNQSASLFGLNQGSIFIGDGTQTRGIAVGSRSGTTRTYSHDLNILAGKGNDDRYAQLGYKVSDQGAGYTVSGNIQSHALNDISAIGGSTDEFNYAQLGHIGAGLNNNDTVEASVTGSISVSAGNNLNFQAGDERAYAQLGNGGYRAYGNHAGDIQIRTANDLNFTGGDDERSYAQLGHGGYNARGNHAGSITIDSASNLNFSAGSDERTYSQLGSGGYGADGNHSTSITIKSAGSLNFTSGSERAYSQLGNGGYSADGNHSGDISVKSIGSLLFSAANERAYSQLGHGGYTADGNHSGSVQANAAHDIRFSAGLGERAYAQLGHAGHSASGNSSGDITATAGGNIMFSSGGEQAYSQLGNGGFESVGNHSGDHSAAAGNKLLFSGSNLEAYTQLGNGGYLALGNQSGNLTASAGTDLTFLSGNEFAYSQLGNGGYETEGNHLGNISASANGDIQFTGGGLRAYSQLGNGGYNTDGNHSGLITANAAANILFTSGSERAYSHLGHGGYSTDGTHTGDITANAGADLSFSAGGERAYSQLGNGGYNSDGDHAGAISASSEATTSLNGGNAERAFAQIGHGGFNFNGNTSGDISVQSGNFAMQGNLSEHTYSYLGHGGFSSEGLSGGQRSGSISLQNNGELRLVNIGNTQLPAWQLGHSSENRIFDTSFDLSTATINYTSEDALLPSATLNQAFVDQFIQNVEEGDVTMNIIQQGNTPSALVLDGNFAYDSDYHLTLTSSDELIVKSGRSIHNEDDGDIVLSSQLFINGDETPNVGNFSVDDGQILIYSNRWYDDVRGQLPGFRNLFELDFAAYGPASANFLEGGKYGQGHFYIYRQAPGISLPEVIALSDAARTVKYEGFSTKPWNDTLYSFNRSKHIRKLAHFNGDTKELRKLIKLANKHRKGERKMTKVEKKRLKALLRSTKTI